MMLPRRGLTYKGVVRRLVPATRSGSRASRRSVHNRQGLRRPNAQHHPDYGDRRGARHRQQPQPAGRFLPLPKAIARVEKHETDQCQCRRKAEAECHYQKQPVGSLVERDGGKQQDHRRGAGDEPTRDTQGEQAAPADLSSIRPRRQVRVHAAAVRMGQRGIVIRVLMVMAVLSVIVRMAMMMVGMVVVIMVHVIVVRMRGVDMMLMRMLGIVVCMTMMLRVVCGGVRAGARLLLRRAPALPQQDDPHPKHQQARYETQNW